MELRHLRYFVAVADAQNFSRAARKLHVSQPPLSVQIGCLEDELGARLFDRTPRGAILTEVGRRFLPKARKLLEQAAEARDVARPNQRRPSEVRIGIIGPAMTPAMADRLGAFRTYHPEVRLRVRHEAAPVLRSQLQAGDIDVAITRPCPPSPDLLQSHLEWQELGLAIPAGHPWAELREIPWSLLKGERVLLVSPEYDPYNGQDFLHACGRQQTQPEIAYAGTDVASLIWLVAAGYGVCPYASAPTERPLPGIVLRPFDPAFPPQELVIARKGPVDSPTLQSLVGHFAPGDAAPEKGDRSAATSPAARPGLASLPVGASSS